MQIIPILLKEMDQEADITRRMLALVPDDKFDWKPHSKSMGIQQLTNHIVELPGWVNIALATDELDFAKNHYEPTALVTAPDLLTGFEKVYAEGRAALESTNETELQKPWTMRNGETIFFTITKAEMIRIAFSQTVHHRAQLGVYFRLLDIPLPGSYGPTADFPTAY